MTHRNGYRERTWATRAGEIELAIPKLRRGSYFPSFLEPRRRSEQALVSVVQEAYVAGVSTRKVDQVVESLGLRISKSEVSRICPGLDEQVDAFRNRPLEGSYPYLWLDAKVEKVRDGGRVVRKCLVLAYGVHESGYREVIALDVGEAETEAFWRSFLRSLVDRGLTGVQLVVSDAHIGLKQAIAAVLAGTCWHAAASTEAVKILCVVFDSRGWLVWYARYAHTTGGPSATRCKVRGVVAASERAPAALGVGGRGAAAGARRRACGRAGGWRQRDDRPQGCL